MAITTSTGFSNKVFNIVYGHFQEVFLQDAFAKGVGNGVFVVLSGEFSGQGKGEVNAEVAFVQISKVVDKRQRAAGVDKAEVRRISKAVDDG